MIPVKPCADHRAGPCGHSPARNWEVRSIGRSAQVRWRVEPGIELAWRKDESRSQSRAVRTQSGTELGGEKHRALSPSEMEGGARNRTCMAKG